MSKRILITGANGQLGSELKALQATYPEYDMVFIDRSEMDLADAEAIKAYFVDKTFDVVINCAAYTAVDKAENEDYLADAINNKVVEVLASIAKEKNISLVHISTDYVFDGTGFKPYSETDSVNPQGVYGKTKLEGEKAMLAMNPSHSVIIRTSWVYSSYGANFVKTMLRLGKERDELGVIYDQVGTPTYARDLAEAIMVMLPQLDNENVEIYHYSDEGVCSWYDFAKAIFELSGTQCHVKPIETKEYPTPAKRPHYSLLNKSKIKEHFNLSIPYWKDSLKECLQKMGEKK